MIRKLLSAAAAGCLLSGIALVGTAHADVSAKGTRPSDPVTNSDGSWQDTKTMTREFRNADGTVETVDSRTVTLKVSQTQQLQGRERISVSWSGAHPSAARAANPFGENGMQQEYPVVLLQCRGTGDQVSPQSCWTSTAGQRTALTTDQRQAIWTIDPFANLGDDQQLSGANPFPSKECTVSEGNYAHITSFVGSGGKNFFFCTAETGPPEAAAGASFPPAEQAAFTNVDGSGETSFEVRSNVENESLGCSINLPCSLVVIPIMGMSCGAPDTSPTADPVGVDYWCRQKGSHPAGSRADGNPTDDAVKPSYWWAGSNWRNRFVVPLSFALPPNACDVLDQRPPVAFYGSELLSQAALQWQPAFCLNKDRFKWQENNMPDEAAFQQMVNGVAAAAEVSGLRDESSLTDPVGYAPTAISGLAVSYVIDKPNNAGEYKTLKLNARLLAKLLTQSYPATPRGQTHPGLETNPLSINVDPEFQQLNPGTLDIPMESAATLMSLSTSSDVITTLTDYIAHDPEAVAFIKGKADPWGMVVNPSYKGAKVPTLQWEMKDTYVPPSSLECYQQNPAPYLPLVAAPVNNLRSISLALLDMWPLVATKCDRASTSEPWKLGRVDRQGMGSRFIIGLSTLADAHRFGLNTAALQTSNGRYVEPTSTSMAAAIATAKPGKKRFQPFILDQGKLRNSGAAYPGTMVVYTAAKTHGLDKPTAKNVASFIRISSTEGQRPGRGNGQLPEGYLPITRSGATKKLFDQAQAVAAAVQAQKAPPQAADAKPAQAGPAGPPAAAAPQVIPGNAPVAPMAPTAPTQEPAAKPIETKRVASNVADSIIPALLFVGFLGAGANLWSRFSLRRKGVA